MGIIWITRRKDFPVSDKLSKYFELKNGSVDRITGELSGAGISVDIPTTAKRVSEILELPLDRISVISEERFNNLYGENGDRED